MKKTRIQTTINIPNGLPCKKEVLGCEFNINIDGVDGVLAFPRLPENYREALRSEDMIDRNLLIPQNADIMLCHDDKQWGHFSSSQGNSNVVNLAIWFPCYYKECEDIAHKLSGKINAYIDKFVLFLEILSGNAFSKETGQSISLEVDDINFTQFWYWNDKKYMVFSPNEVSVTINVILNKAENFINNDTISKAIEYANKGLDHNLAHKVLRESNQHITNKEYRKSILDAATAIEIAFTRKIIEELDKRYIDDKLKASLLKKYHSLSGRIELAQSLNIDLPCKIDDYKSFLAKIRNKAIHAGHIPSTEEARKVIEIAKMTVMALCKEYE